jgi:Domain of unknown function (DUF4129)
VSKGPSDVADGARSRAGVPMSAAAGARRAHLLLVGLLIALVIAGIAAGPALHWSASWQGPWHQRGTDVGIALEVVLAALLIALWVRVRRARASGESESHPARRLRSALIPVIIAAMITILLGIWHAHIAPGRLHSITPPKLGLPKHVRVTPPTGHSSASSFPDLRYALLALVAAAVIAAFMILLRRSLRQVPPEPEVSLEDDDDSAVLQAALRAGRAALASLTEDRQAIIACYAAMERSLAGAGAAREIAETPDELLARASGAGLLHGDPPATLTALFYQARFSSHAVPNGARATALRCLDAIEADLRTASAPVSS